jgi:hypothetical protein
MRANIKKFGDQPFEIPAGISQIWINKETGRKVAPNSPGAIIESFAEYSEQGVETVGPDGTTKMRVPVKARALGDDEYFENQ